MSVFIQMKMKHRTGDLKSFLLQPYSPGLAQSQEPNNRTQNHEPKHSPKTSPVAIHQRLCLLSTRLTRDNSRNHLQDSHAESAPKLRGGVEDSPGQCLRIGREDIRDDDQSDGEKGIEAYGL